MKVFECSIERLTKRDLRGLNFFVCLNSKICPQYHLWVVAKKNQSDNPKEPLDVFGLFFDKEMAIMFAENLEVLGIGKNRKINNNS